MNTLVINTGSSSIKYQFINMPSGEVLSSGLVERIGEETGIITHKKFTNGIKSEVTFNEEIPSHEIGMKRVASLLSDEEYGVISNPSDVKLVGHRIVLGGERFSKTLVITEEVKKVIEELSSIAPLHNPPNLIGIHVAEQIFTEATQIGVFDTSFHSTLPEYAFRYALPEYLYTKHGIRVYGFHGTSHQYVTERAALMLDKELDKVNLITIHLGNGIAEVKRIINKESGLKGLTGNNDLRFIEEQFEKGDEKAALALKIYAYRIKKYIGSYLAIIGRVDAIVFTAGVGENSSTIRRMATEGLSHLGIEINEELNLSKSKLERAISSEDAKIKTLVIPTNEELEIAKQSFLVYNKQ